MSDREIKLLLKDMLEAAQKILAYTQKMSFEDFAMMRKRSIRACLLFAADSAKHEKVLPIS